MDFKTILTLAISAPITTGILMLGLYKIKGKVRASIDTDGKLSIETGEAPARRETDSPEWSERFASRIIEAVRSGLAHECVQADLVRVMADGHEKHTDAIIRVTEVAKDHGWNGDTQKIHDEQVAHKQEFHEVVIERAFPRREAQA